jgi:hypothetical protein
VRDQQFVGNLSRRCHQMHFFPKRAGSAEGQNWKHPFQHIDCEHWRQVSDYATYQELALSCQEFADGLISSSIPRPNSPPT